MTPILQVSLPTGMLEHPPRHVMSIMTDTGYGSERFKAQMLEAKRVNSNPKTAGILHNAPKPKWQHQTDEAMRAVLKTNTVPGHPYVKRWR